MNLLQGREYTTSQLRTKLQQGFYPPKIIEQAIDYVAGFHYIDDLRYAVDYITYHEAVSYTHLLPSIRTLWFTAGSTIWLWNFALS